MECPYCGVPLEEFHQYCPSCGKLVSIVVHPPQPKMISLQQIILILIAGFSSYFLIIILNSEFDLPFSFFLYLGLDSSLIMSYMIFYFYIRSRNALLIDFFPYYREFLIIMAILIWFSSLWVNFSFNITGDNLNDQLFSFTIEYVIGYIVGLSFVGYFYYDGWKKRKERQIQYDLQDSLQIK